MKWWRGLLGLERDGLEQKSIIGIGDGLSQWGGVSRQDGNNFRTNQVALAHFQDAVATSNPIGLTATWACVNLLAGTIASLPLMVYRTSSAGVRTVARDHPLYWLLHDSPNYDQTAVDFWEYMQAGIELHGNAYAEIETRGEGFIVSLTPIRPDIVQTRRVGGEIEYSWTIDGKRSVVGQGSILHIRGFGGGPLGGASTLSICRGAFGSAMATERAAANTFANGVNSTGVLTADAGNRLTPDQMEDTRRSVEEKYTGAMNAGRPMILNAGMKWQQISISPEDAQMLETRKWGVEEICRVFGVPPHMIGHSEKSTSWGTGIEQQTLGFQKFTLRRRLKRIEQALEKQLLAPRDRVDGITIEFNLEGLLRGDSAGRAGFYQSMTQMGAMTINEVRALENLPPVAGGDIPRMQSQNVPISGPESVSGSQTAVA